MPEDIAYQISIFGGNPRILDAEPPMWNMVCKIMPNPMLE